MSAVFLSEVKAHLRVTHDDDDGYIQGLIDAAEGDALLYLERDTFPPARAPSSFVSDVADPVRISIFLMVQAMYEGRDGASMEALRETGYKLMRPYRACVGV